jgi:hypothetical protein
VPEQREPADLRRHVAIGLRRLQRRTERHHGPADVALEERDEAKLTTGAIHPRLVTEPLGNCECLLPSGASQHGVEVLVRLALDDKAAQAQAVVTLNARELQILRQLG